jgi:hypothetical protein
MWTTRFLLSVSFGISVLGACDDDGSSDCANSTCPDTINCADGKVLVALEGACCPSCEATPVDAGHGCLCSPKRDPVCGEDFVLYQNSCFANCARVDVIAEGACPSRAQFPAGNYGEACDGDGACDVPYECLPAAHGDALDPDRRICATRCETVDDCPPVISDHCGDQTVCTDGICGFFFCQ